MFDWDVEPYEKCKEQFVLHAVKVLAGTGRWHTRHQAARVASQSRSDYAQNEVGPKWRNVQRHVERHRDDRLKPRLHKK
jgi:hypothetical protein